MNDVANPADAHGEGPTIDPALDAVFEAAPSPMIVVQANEPTFTVLAVNAAHRQAFHLNTPIVGRGLFEAFPAEPDPAALAFKAVIQASFERAMASGCPDDMPVMPYVVVDIDGSDQHRFWSAIHTPVPSVAGKVERILSTVRDVTSEVNERRIAEARELLMREVDHRARNALTVVQTLVRLTQAEDLDTYKSIVLGRVETLARVQTSLALHKWEGASLDEVVRAAVAGLVGAERVMINGPAVLLPPEQVQAVGMALHELGTNACKYGALSAPRGAVRIAWTLAGSLLKLTWQEEGGPAVTSPQSLGFGSRLLSRLAHQVGGTIHQDWRPHGLCTEFTAQLPPQVADYTTTRA
jgi:two-component sensor histidine kinase